MSEHSVNLYANKSGIVTLNPESDTKYRARIVHGSSHATIFHHDGGSSTFSNGVHTRIPIRSNLLTCVQMDISNCTRRLG